MDFPTSKRKPPLRYARLDGKALPKPRGRHTGKPPDTTREIVTIPVNQRLGFRVAEFAGLVGVSTTTVWRQIKRGQIEVVEQNGMKIIPRAYAVRIGLISDNV